MIPYYIAFLISILFCFLGERNMRSDSGYLLTTSNSKLSLSCNKKKIIIKTKLKKPTFKKYHLYFVIAVLIVSILAGLRGYTVGTDIQSYGNSLFYSAKNFDSLFDFVTSSNRIEPLYLSLVYLSSLLSKEPHILYFFTGLIIYSFILAGFIRYKKTVPITLSWICFLFLLYGDTYNAMRQCLALSIGFWSFKYAINERYFLFLFWVFIAYLFHNTGVIYILVFFIYMLLKINKSFLMKLFIIISAIVGIIFFNNILSSLIGYGILGDQISKYYITTYSGLSLPAILIRLPMILLVILNRRKFKEYNDDKFNGYEKEVFGDFIILTIIAEMMSVELSAFIPSLYRISLYFVPFKCLGYSRLCLSYYKKNDINLKVLIIMFLVIYLLMIFIYQNQIKGNNEIYPYIFADF